MKKLIIMLFIVVTFGVVGNSQVYRYDVNGDGHVTSADVTAIYNYMMGLAEFEEHEYVDLGLPSGTLWATMNVGATAPEEYGDYFAWGETAPKDVYNWGTYKWCNGDYDQLTKYCDNSSYGYNGFVDNKTELDPMDDAAYVNWGPEWRMPSLDQIKELLNECDWQWTTRNGVNGRLATSKHNGASLFLPAAGCRWEDDLVSLGSFNGCWSRTLYSSDPFYAYACSLLFGSGDVGGYTGWRRIFGQSVRAVRVS